MKTIAIVLSLAVSGIAISSAYNSAYADRMNGKATCGQSICMQDRYKAAMAKKSHMAKPKKPVN